MFFFHHVRRSRRPTTNHPARPSAQPLRPPARPHPQADRLRHGTRSHGPQRVAADPIFARTGFGTADLAVIFARIARGLHLAQALEARVIRRAAWLDQEPRPCTARPAPRPRPPASPPAEASDPHLAHLPTAEQIAALVRRRPIGAVIADIYRDLGILPSHPLWREVQQAMCQFGGSLARLLCDILDRAFPLKPPTQAPAMQAAAPGPASAPPGTGPP
jgi:hypothetical protein